MESKSIKILLEGTKKHNEVLLRIYASIEFQASSFFSDPTIPA